ALGGGSAAIAILIRPNLFPLAAVLGARYLIEAKRDWRHLLRGVLFFAMSAIGVAVTALVNRRLYGSPFVSGYGDLKTNFGTANMVPNMRLYAGWLIDVQTPL